MQCTVYVGELKLIHMCILTQHQITHAEIKYYKYFHSKGVSRIQIKTTFMKHNDTSCVEWNSDVIKNIMMN